jgi:hypothetical protein
MNGEQLAPLFLVLQESILQVPPPLGVLPGSEKVAMPAPSWYMNDI